MRSTLFKYLVTVITGSLLMTGVISLFVNKGLRRSPTDFYGKINYILDSNNHINILLAGSSRVVTNIDPFIIDSVTHLNSYNAGLNAATIKTCYNIITAAINSQPHLSCIILNIDYNMFRPDVDPYKDAYYYPYKDDINTAISPKHTASNKIHKIKILDATAYDDYVKYASVRGLLNSTRIGIEKGFFPHVQQGFSVPDANTLKPGVEEYDESGRMLLEKIMQLCKEKNIEMVMLVAPYQKNYAPSLYIQNYNEILNWVKSEGVKYRVHYLDYTDIPIATDTAYFYNSWHLNIQGARVYSIQVANDLKQYIQQKSGDIK